MIKLTNRRYEIFRRLFENTVKFQARNVIFAYGTGLFKFHYQGRTIEVNKETIIIRKVLDEINEKNWNL